MSGNDKNEEKKKNTTNHHEKYGNSDKIKQKV